MPPPARPLEGIRVLDVSDSIGAYCTKLLAGLGADVTKLEYPEGDELRRRPPFRDGASGSEASLVFTYYHADKRSITLDTRRTESLPDLEELGNTADVIVISPSRRRPLAGFDETSLAVSWAREHAVVCAITPYGLTGPYRHRRATHFVGHATSGSMHKVGPEAGPPVTIPAQQHWDEASAHAAVCILAALQNRAAVGGQTIDISAHEVAVDARLRVRPVRRDGHDAGSHRGDRLSTNWYVAVQGRAVRRRRASNAPLDCVPADARRSRRALGSFARRRSRAPGDLRRSGRDDRQVAGEPQPRANSSSGAKRSACPAPS